jgi:1-deoxy-D-xylulose 5-phosphate reductoisomerase
LFLDGKLGFTGIAAVIEQTMTAHRPAEVRTLAEVRAVDHLAREHARGIARGLELKV